MRVPLSCGYLLIRGESSFFLVARAPDTFALPIETNDAEVFQGVHRGDLIVVSAPEGGDPEQARMLCELVRTYRQPMVVLPKGHPGSSRLRMVISVAPAIMPKADIIRGTHPDQDVICSSGELSGLGMAADGECVCIEGFDPNRMEYLLFPPGPLSL
ncbi:hypothetical protein [Methanogenium organophilum]|uniref:Uncharacterized protein n=1 Tax=Methanogenium organophilum TaxID=2199 RepID=A0A9X9S6C9_METOG|nr:hypothetical protein [Methanogenium organophilum]WAI02248.1 hypothetical protein OU421_05090 [Methanogenium organophilum]